MAALLRCRLLITRPLPSPSPPPHLFLSTSQPPSPPSPSPSPSLINDLCRLLSDHRSPHHDLESALLPFSPLLTPSLLDHLLRRSRHLPSASHRLFLFASSLPNFTPSPLSLLTLLHSLSSPPSPLFPLAWSLLSHLPSPIPRPSFHILFRSYAKSRLPSEAVRAFHRMGDDFHLPPDADDVCVLVSALCRYKFPDEATKFFRGLVNIPATQKTYSLLMQGWASVGNSTEALRLFDEMRETFPVDVYAYNALIFALCKGGRLDEAYTRLKEMRRVDGLEPNAATYSAFVRTHCDAKDARAAMRMVENMWRKNLSPNVFTYNCVVKLLCEKEEVEEAHELLDEMMRRGEKPDVWGYNAILATHCRLREVNRALRVLERMDRDGCLPDRHTYNMLLKMLVGVGRIDKAVEVWDGMEGRGFYPSASSYAVMVHGLCKKKGTVEEACRFFEMMVEEGVPPYLSTCEVLRAELWRVGLRERIMVLADKMRRSTSCTIQELAGAMEKSRGAEKLVVATKNNKNEEDCEKERNGEEQECGRAWKAQW